MRLLLFLCLLKINLIRFKMFNMKTSVSSGISQTLSLFVDNYLHSELASYAEQPCDQYSRSVRRAKIF